MAIFYFFFMTWQRKNGLDISCSCKNRPTSRWWRNLVLSLLFQDDCFSKRKRNLFLGHKGKYNQQFLCSSVRSSFNNFLFFHNSDGKTSHILFLKDGSHRVTALLFLTWQDQLLSPLKAMINLPYEKSLAASLSPNWRKLCTVCKAPGKVILINLYVEQKSECV